MTIIFILLLIVVASLAAVFVSDHYARLLRRVGLGAVALGLLGCTLPFLLPKDFFVVHPALAASPLHPCISTALGLPGFLLGGGILFGLFVRRTNRG